MAIKVSLCQNANPHMWSKGKKRVKKSSLKGKSAKRDLFFSNCKDELFICIVPHAFQICKRISLKQSQSKALNWFELHALFLWCAIPTRITSYLKHLSLVHQPRSFFSRDKSTRKIHPRWTRWGRHFGFRIQTAEGQSIETNQATCEWKGPNLRSFANAIYECCVFCSGGFKWELYRYNKVAQFVSVVVYTWLWSITSISIVTRRHAAGLHWSNDCHLSKEMTIRDCLANKKCIYCSYGWIQMRAGTSYELRTAKLEKMISW